MSPLQAGIRALLFARSEMTRPGISELYAYDAPRI